ncbi:Transcriptional regulator [Seminavis robusta]|uniref:Transcriptional regulator n=1 Tax=Seminavis robusta TaxID=568900 RepID=A0A9N8E4D9_9STRA|nr:Transcriptional regulator [Seminavis robusta]|eukprot:Sro652_g181880.1 Transcriptional regulator (1360) ;mRNA; f:44131-48378
MASTTMERRGLEKVGSMRLLMIQKHGAHRSSDHHCGDTKTMGSSVTSLGTVVSGGSRPSRSSVMLRMHDSIVSAVDNWDILGDDDEEEEDEEESLLHGEDEDHALTDNFDILESQLEREEAKLGSEDDPCDCGMHHPPSKTQDLARLSGTSFTQGSTASSIESDAESAAKHLPTLLRNKSAGLTSLSSLPPCQNRSNPSLCDYDTDDDSVAGTERPSSIPSRPSKLLLTGNSQHSVLTRWAPESAKLRGASGLTASTVAGAPLPMQLAELGLFGRDTEVQQLRRALDKCIVPKNKCIYKPKSQKECSSSHSSRSTRQVAWIAGASGSGKTALAEYALQLQVTNRGGLYVSGKFENNHYERTSTANRSSSVQPLAGFASSCDDLCVQLLALKEGRQEEFQNLLEALQAQMAREEFDLLLGLLPGLGPFIATLEETMGDDSAASSEQQMRDSVVTVLDRPLYTAEESENQSKDLFQFVFRKFVRVVASVFPLVLVLDDLQWADLGSLELLEVLALDCNSLSNVMLVGCYRDDAVDAEHPLTSVQTEIAEKPVCEVVHIKLKDLDSTDLNLLLSELLQKEPSETETLASICYKKCGGNAFYLVRFVTMLWQEKLVKFDIMSDSWKWNHDEIAERSKATENVVNFLHSQLAGLPESTRQVLLFASCLGTEFEMTTMELIMADFYPGTPYESDLSRCVSAGILETTTSAGECRGYRWIHDKLMEAAQTLLSPEELCKLKYCVGAVLLKSFNAVDQEEDLFLIANLLNEAPNMSDTPVSLAELNLRAARRAASLSSFWAAADYCRQGIDLLPESKWTSDFELTLQLHSLAGDMYSTLGESDSMKRQCNEVISRSDVSIYDKVLPYQCVMVNLFNQGKVEEALNMCLDVLRELGVTFPTNKLQIGVKIQMGMNKAASDADSACEQLRNLPLLQDPKHKATMRFLTRLGTFGYLAKSPLLPLANLKLAKYSLKHGLGNDTPKNTACIGMMVGSFLDKIQEGSKYGMACLELLERIPAKRRVLPEAHYIVYAHVLHNTQPVHQMMKPLLNAYGVALEYGASLYASYSIYHYLLFAFRSGKSLRAIETDLRAYTVQMEDMHMHKAMLLSKILWQLVMNLMGVDGTSPLVLTGQAMDEVDFLASCGSEPYYKTMFQCYQNVLFAVLGKHELGAELAISKGDMIRVHPGTPAFVMDVFYQAVSCFSVARTSKKKKYKEHAKKMKQKIDGWAKQGNPNVLHFASFLSAERAALKGKNEEAEKLYETSIVTARKQGFIQDAALANERLAEFHEDVLKDKASAGFRYQEAIRLYTEWGALHKAKMIKKTKADLLQFCSASSHPEEVHLNFRIPPESVSLGCRSVGCSSKGSSLA